MPEEMCTTWLDKKRKAKKDELIHRKNKKLIETVVEVIFVLIFAVLMSFFYHKFLRHNTL